MLKIMKHIKRELSVCGCSRKIAIVLSLFCICLISVFFIACGRAKDVTNTAEQGEQADAQGDNVVMVYNAGEYIDPEVPKLFEEETGIKVIYDTFETNEEMYPVIQAGGVVYDAVCPSDYMIEKMMQNHLLQEVNFNNVPNIKEIGKDYMKMCEQFDPGNKYVVPYTTGTVGILYNKKMLDELGVPYPTKWADLWNPKLKGEILMQDSVRDAFMVALKKEGHSMNTVSDAELDEALQDLIKQKPLVQAYVVDQVRDKMIGEEAAVGVIYSGEILYVQGELEGTDVEIDYAIPEEGTNVWFDGWVIPWNAKHKENAEKWMNFLCRPDIAAKNFEYITYPTPNVGALALLDKSYTENKAVFPDMKEVLKKGEVYTYLGEENEAKYNNRWKILKAS
ncbi:ABC transporter substrate-binding protein [Oribacterium sp. oral taxon 108]|uniref:ABC transporter substrate-binding protein n=1 Tax=Oribacterium sp. oral taxon 108 TaxID=712414 RepID=UPI00020DD3B9|nr:putative spermidine/putrescine ABC transporter, periplasmic spermidine/putrescine-binding protein PotD [Oribacterium sp. oral taxon 108 str. F0425]